MNSHTMDESRVLQPPARDWKSYLMPKPFDWVSTPLYLCVFALYVYHSLPQDRGYRPFPWAITLILGGMTVILLTIDRLEYWRFGETPPQKIAALFLLARIVLIELTAQLDGFNFSAFLYFLIPFYALQSFPGWIAYLLSGLAWITYLVKTVQVHDGWYADTMNGLILFSLGLIFVNMMGKTVLKEKNSRARAEKLLYELEASHRQLAAYSAQVGELATAKERNRLAREIHDSLGHYLTVINVQLEKALAFRDKNPAEADQAIRDAKCLASEALQDTRQSVSTLRSASEAFSLFHSLGDLVRHMHGSQVAIELDCQGDERLYSKPVLMTLYRAAQEGLTNIQKHAQASHGRVIVKLDEMVAHLYISDDGCGLEPGLSEEVQPGLHGGYGLQGVQERLELVGGSLAIESQPGVGTRLLIRIPRVSPVQTTREFQP